MTDKSTVLVYTSPNCAYCNAAKNLLRNKGVAFAEIDVGGDSALRQDVMARSGRRTVPQIFIDGQSVGGYDDIAALNASGELDRLLQLQGGSGTGSAN